MLYLTKTHGLISKVDTYVQCVTAAPITKMVLVGSPNLEQFDQTEHLIFCYSKWKDANYFLFNLVVADHRGTIKENTYDAENIKS